MRIREYSTGAGLILRIQQASLRISNSVNFRLRLMSRAKGNDMTLKTLFQDIPFNLWIETVFPSTGRFL